MHVTGVFVALVEDDDVGNLLDYFASLLRKFLYTTVNNRRTRELNNFTSINRCYVVARNIDMCRRCQARC